MSQISTYNANGMKALNKRNILEYIRRRPCSRAELARLTGLTRAAITVIADHLIQEKIILEGEPIPGKVGRSSRRLSFNPLCGCILGIALGRIYNEAALFLFDGTLLESTKIESSFKDSPDTVIEILCQKGLQMKKNLAPDISLLGAGIITPGPICKKTGTILNPPNFDVWTNYPIVRMVKNHLSVPVVFEGDINAVALAERYFGKGREYDNYLEVNLDTGVGCGLIINGELYNGLDNFYGQIGHMTIDIHGPVCKCGNIGCAELYASLPNILRYASNLNKQLDSWTKVVTLAETGDSDALTVLRQESFYLASMIVNVWNVVDLQAIIINGKIAEQCDFLIQELYLELQKRISRHLRKEFSIHASALPPNHMTLSACNLVIDHFIKNIF